MRAVFFEPHHDDAVLFACYQLLRLKPLVVTVFGDAQAQEPRVTAVQRTTEQLCAMDLLDLSWVGWSFPDTTKDAPLVRGAIAEAMRQHLDADLVIFPLWEEGGHEQHNIVAEVAATVFGGKEWIRFATYRRGSGRSRTDIEVVAEDDWPARKFEAMACYRSQITLESTRPWFCSDDCLREWVA